MSVSQLLPWPAACPHATRREGVRLGVILGLVTWLWVALIDVATGQPFHTFSGLGGIVGFTVIHFLLNIVYGMVLISVIHSAERAPSVIMGMLFCGIVVLLGGSAMMTSILAAATLGNGAWLRMFGGNVIATTVAIVLIGRTHPLLEYVHRAEDEL